MQITGSPNFTDFNFRFCVDLSTPTSAINLTDLSTYIANGFEGIIFNIYTPTGLIIHQGDWGSPDITNENDIYTFSPLVFMGGILMTGNYKVEAWIKDQNGVIYQWSLDGNTFKTIDVCLPNSIDGAVGYYGGMNLTANTDCDAQRLCFFDYTSYTYQGMFGSFVSTSLKVIYPPDPNTFEQQPAQAYTLIPSCYSITVNGRYQFQAVRIVNYELGNDCCIQFRYQFTNENYIVSCNVDLCAIQCDYERLIATFDDALCSNDINNIAKYGNKLLQINSLINSFNQGQKCGEDVTGIVAKIIEVGGFTCDNCSPSVIVPNPIICNNGVFTVVTPCGDITSTVTQEGNNVQISLQDITYQFVIDQASQVYLTKTTQVSGCVSQTTFTLDLSSITDSLCKVRVDSDDSCCEYLSDKIVSSDASLTIAPTAPDEDGCKALDVIMTPMVWHNITPLLSWTLNGRFQYSKDAYGMVTLRGSLVSPNPALITAFTPKTVGILPAGFRPTGTTSGEYGIQLFNNGSFGIDVDLSGNVQLTFFTTISNVTTVFINFQFNVAS